MILIIGGGGFLGQHLRSMPQKHDFVVVHRGEQPPPLSNQERFLSLDAFEGPAGDDAIRHASAVVYLATSSVPGTFEREPWREATENLQPALRLFSRFGALNPSAKIVLASSGGTIYGVASGGAVTELAPSAPISAYGYGKLMVEQGLTFAHRTLGTPYNILRIANPVGRFHRGAGQGLVPVAIRTLLDGRRFRVFGDGGNVRDYIDADDVARAILLACEDKKHTAATWNVGSGQGHSVLGVLERVTAIAERPLGIDFEPSRGVDVPYVVLDSGKIAQDLGWTPEIDLDASINRVWRSFHRETPPT